MKFITTLCTATAGTGIGLAGPVAITIKAINSSSSESIQNKNSENFKKPEIPVPAFIKPQKPQVQKVIEKKSQEVQQTVENNQQQNEQPSDSRNGKDQRQQREETSTTQKQPKEQQKKENKPRSKLKFKFGWEDLFGTSDKKEE